MPLEEIEEEFDVELYAKDQIIKVVDRKFKGCFVNLVGKLDITANFLMILKLKYL